MGGPEGSDDSEGAPFIAVDDLLPEPTMVLDYGGGGAAHRERCSIEEGGGDDAGGDGAKSMMDAEWNPRCNADGDRQTERRRQAETRMENDRPRGDLIQAAEGRTERKLKYGVGRHQ